MERARTLISSQGGQTTAEYAATLLVVVLVAAALGAFVKGGGLDGMFETIIEGVVTRAGK